MGGVATEKALNKVIKSIVSTKAMITNSFIMLIKLTKMCQIGEIALGFVVLRF